MLTIQFFFSVQGISSSAMGLDPENRVDVQDTSPGRPVSVWLQAPGDPGHCALTRPRW
jgi:hypothetical protein